MATLSELYAGRNLTGLVQGIKPGLPLRIPAQLLQPTDRVPGNSFSWDEIDGNREMAVIVSQKSPAKRVGHRGVKRKSATMLRTFMSQVFDMNDLRNILVPGSPNMVRDEMGRNYIQQQTTDFKTRIVNLVQTCCQVMLFKFALHFDENGKLLTSSSGAAVSIEVGIPAGQQGQLDILGDGAIIGASWATAGTDIVGHIESIKEQMLQLAGWQITEAYYGRNIAKYIGANTVAKEYINRTPSLATQMFERGTRVPQGFQELNWHYAGDAFYLDAAGAVQKPLGPDEIVFTPSPSDTSWWKHANGSEMVPTGLGQVGMKAEEMLANVREVIGEFSYAELINNPLSIEQFYGHNFLPIITATKAVCKADVTP